MTTPAGTQTTYELTTGVMLDFEPLIHLLDPIDVPLLGMYGIDGNTALANEPVTEKKVEWQDETLLTPRSTLQTTIIAGDAFLRVAAGDRGKFSTGDVIILDSEHMRVTGYGTTADSLLVTRGFGGDTAAGHTAAVAVVGVGQALSEGSDPEAARAVDRTGRHNFTQIFGPTAVQVSGSEQAVRKYGLGAMTEYDKQAGNRMKETFIALEQAILYGSRYEDTATKVRTMGGLSYYITTNVDSTTTDITEAALLTQIQGAYDVGGAPDRLVVGSTQKRKISALRSADIQIERGDNGRGQVVDYLDTDFGRSSFILDRWVRKTDAFGFNRDQATVGTLRPIALEQLAKTGDSVKGQIVGEKTLRFRKERHSFRFSALQ